MKSDLAPTTTVFAAHDIAGFARWVVHKEWSAVAGTRVVWEVPQDVLPTILAAGAALTPTNPAEE